VDSRFPTEGTEGKPSLPEKGKRKKRRDVADEAKGWHTEFQKGGLGSLSLDKKKKEQGGGQRGCLKKGDQKEEKKRVNSLKKMKGAK